MAQERIGGESPQTAAKLLLLGQLTGTQLAALSQKPEKAFVHCLTFTRLVVASGALKAVHIGMQSKTNEAQGAHGNDRNSDFVNSVLCYNELNIEFPIIVYYVTGPTAILGYGYHLRLLLLIVTVMMVSWEWLSLKCHLFLIIINLWPVMLLTQCLDRGRQTGQVKGEYHFSHLKRQDCRKLMKKRDKLRPAGFLAPEARRTGLEVRPLLVAPLPGDAA
eukprot:4425390-Amphidinium_carterae.1